MNISSPAFASAQTESQIPSMMAEMRHMKQQIAQLQANQAAIMQQLSEINRMFSGK